MGGGGGWCMRDLGERLTTWLLVPEEKPHALSTLNQHLRASNMSIRQPSPHPQLAHKALTLRGWKDYSISSWSQETLL